MRLTAEGLKQKKDWEAANIALPDYDVQEVGDRTQKAPVWLHLGIGNIFRIFMGGIADQLIRQGVMDRGIICGETFDYEIVDRIFSPHDNLALGVILHGDGTEERRVLGSMAEAVKAKWDEPESWERLKEIFCDPGLQMVSFTITEKGYGLTKTDGTYTEMVQKDMENGPQRAVSAMAVTAAMLLERYRSGKWPIALVSMDNCPKNGEKLGDAVRTVAEEWIKRGYADEGFLAYLSDETQVSFPWTMIDKITPRPSERTAKELEDAGVEGMMPIVTAKHTYIAPFVNAEGPQYLVVEDRFPNGRPPLEKAGVYMTDRDTVNQSERMKVTACLNPIHSALGPYGCLLGYELFSDEMNDPDMLALARLVGYGEGLQAAPDPKILSPKKFLDEVLNERFPNPYLGDTTQRLCVDLSQMVGIRFGETIKTYVSRYGDAKKLIGIPLAVAGWLRYLLAVDDEGKPFALAPDPMIPELQKRMEGISFGDPSSVGEKLRPILSETSIFGMDLYAAGIGERIEEMFCREIKGPGAVRKTVQIYLSSGE